MISPRQCAHLTVGILQDAVGAQHMETKIRAEDLMEWTALTMARKVGLKGDPRHNWSRVIEKGISTETRIRHPMTYRQDQKGSWHPLNFDDHSCLLPKSRIDRIGSLCIMNTMMMFCYYLIQHVYMVWSPSNGSALSFDSCNGTTWLCNHFWQLCTTHKACSAPLFGIIDDSKWPTFI